MVIFITTYKELFLNTKELAWLLNTQPILILILMS